MTLFLYHFFWCVMMNTLLLLLLLIRGKVNNSRRTYSRPNIIIIIIILNQTQSCEYVHEVKSNNINRTMRKYLRIIYTYDDWLIMSIYRISRKKRSCDVWVSFFFARLFSFFFYDLGLCYPHARLNIHTHTHTYPVYHFMLIWFVIVLILLSKCRSTYEKIKINGTHTRNNLTGSNQSHLRVRFIWT